MNKRILDAYPAEHLAENGKEVHSFMAMGAGDISGVAAKMGREGVSPLGYVVC